MGRECAWGTRFFRVVVAAVVIFGMCGVRGQLLDCYTGPVVCSYYDAASCPSPSLLATIPATQANFTFTPPGKPALDVCSRNGATNFVVMPEGGSCVGGFPINMLCSNINTGCATFVASSGSYPGYTSMFFSVDCVYVGSGTTTTTGDGDGDTTSSTGSGDITTTTSNDIRESAASTLPWFLF